MLTNRIRETLDEMRGELESVETRLRQSQRCYRMQGKLCFGCGRTLPMAAKKCHPCFNSTLEQKYCTTELRIADYFDILRTSELWPSTEPFRKCSITDIASRFACLKRDLRHQCDMASECPLHFALEELSKKVDRIKKAVPGLC
jgi:ribosomal protein L40E